MGVGKRIDELRYAKELSQRQMARDLHISHAALNNYLRERRVPGAEMLKSIAEYFGVTTDYLLGFAPKIKETVGALALTENEMALLCAYKQLKNEQQQFVIDMTKRLITMNNTGR